MPNDDIPWLLLERYCAGKCAPDGEDWAALQSWVADNPTRRLLVERLRTLFVDEAPTPDKAEIERAWSALVAALDKRLGGEGEPR